MTFNFLKNQETSMIINQFSTDLSLSLSREKPQRKKRCCDTYTINSEWVTASSTKNFMLKDPLLDWLGYHYETFIQKHPQYTESVLKSLGKLHKQSSQGSTPQELTLTEFMMKQGNDFEKNLVSFLTYTVGNSSIINIGGTHFNASHSKGKVQKTINAMKQGIPFIYSPVFHDPETKTLGVPDLLVRSDYLKRLVTISPIKPEEETISTSFFSQKRQYHYRVVDFKYMTLRLRCDGHHLLNEGLMLAYKSQLYIYNHLLSKIQGYDPGVAYILGRRWKYKVGQITYKGSSCFDRLGIIDYRGIDSHIIEDTQKAMDWLRYMRKEGANWDPYQKDKKELFPNMCNKYDYPWREVKTMLANDIKEITSLWICGVKNREKAHSHNIYSWIDTQCNVESLGITSKKAKKVLKEMLKINRPTHKNYPKILPNQIRNNERNWQHKNVVEFYIDFETLNDSIYTPSVPTQNHNLSMIFMIGIGYQSPTTQEWIYQDFTVSQLSREEEYRICKEFSQYLFEIMEKYSCKDPLLVHWTKTETIFWNKAQNYHQKGNFWDKVSELWFDLYSIFLKEPIVIENCLSFGLKEVARAMYKHQLIETTWEETSCTDGSHSMVLVYKASQESEDIREQPIMQEVIEYNEVDCKVLCEIIQYLRLNHSKKTQKRKRVSRKEMS